MTTLPSTEAILLAVLQSLGGNRYPTKKKDKFVTGGGSLEKHLEMTRDIMQAIFDALDLDDASCACAARNMASFAGGYKVLELETWTFDADERQVLWMLLGYFYMPILARHIAWWTIDCRMDRNMAGGRFWYLPEPQHQVWYLPEPQHQDGDSLLLPVAQVVDWLLDLLGMPLEKFADHRSEATDGGHDGLRRILYEWRKSTTPEWSTLQKYFADDAKFEFKGAFHVAETAAPEAKFAAARDFVHRKQLTAERLRNEIPMTAPGLLESVLEGRANADEAARFVQLIADRYAPPSPQTIRLYLRVARAAQDGYVRLLEILCPGVERLCADPGRNKLLQVFSLYKYVYNLTIEAWVKHGGSTQDADDIWFESQLLPQLACGPLLAISPSAGESGLLMLTKILNGYFLEAQPGAELENLLAVGRPTADEISERNFGRPKAIMDLQREEAELATRLNAGSPWTKLRAETNFNVVRKIATNPKSSTRILEAALARLHALATTHTETVQAIIAELYHHLNKGRLPQTKETKTRVQALLDQAKINPAFATWKPVILHNEAKHLLAQNEFGSAQKLFYAAREACKTRSFGTIRGEIARDCFTLELVNRRLIHNHEPYYRDMLSWLPFPPGEAPTLEDSARSVSDYFWDTLYQPYPNFEVLRRRSEKEAREFDEPFLKFLRQKDREGFLGWIQANRKRLASPLPDVEGNSYLLQNIKIRSQFATILRDKDPTLLEVWDEHIGLLIQHGPVEQLDWADLKAQTPLMPMAEDGNTRMVQMLLAKGADPNRQDYRGLSPLHAAIKSRVSSSVDALLDHPCRMDFLTSDKRSALHTAA